MGPCNILGQTARAKVGGDRSLAVLRADTISERGRLGTSPRHRQNGSASRTMDIRAAQCSLAGSALALLAGCGSAGHRSSAVRHHPAVERVELVQMEAATMHAPPSASDRDGRAMRIALGQRPGPPGRPSGRSVGSRTPSGSARMTLGSEHIAVVGARPCGSGSDRYAQAGDTWPGRARAPCTAAGKPLLWDDWRPAASNAIWLCDRDGEALGKVDLQWLEPDGEILEAGTVWDDSGQRLAAWVSTESRTHLGLVDTSLYAFDSLVCIDDLHQWGAGSPILL